MRVLHLIDAASPQARAPTLALIADALGRTGEIGQFVALLGGGALGRAAASVGLAEGPSVWRVGAPLGRALPAWPALRHALHRRGAKPGRGVDLIHCWSVGTFTLAGLAWRGVPRLLTLCVEPGPRAARWLRPLVADAAAPVALLATGATIRRSLLTAGLPRSVVHVLRPGLDLGRVAHGARADLRRAWGIDASSEPHVKIVALLGDPPEGAEALGANLAVGLAAQARDPSAAPRWRLLVHPDARDRLRAQRLNRAFGQPDPIVVESRLAQPWSVLPGCDAALTLGAAGGGLSLLWAMAANVPIVGDATYAVSEIVEDHHSALLAKPGEAKALARRLAELFTDPALAWRLRDTARHEAFSFFSRQRYVQSLTRVYEQVADDRPVEVPAMEVTGGLRFTGRA